jgi:Spy/CpxP family protein refolding chaperone
MDVNQVNRKAVLLVFLVFVLGITLGSIGTRLYITHQRVEHSKAERNPVGTTEMFTKHLDLSPEQQKQIETILNETRARYAEIHKEADPAYEEARQESREEIRKILTPEQLSKFEDLLQRMDEKRQKRERAEQQR